MTTMRLKDQVAIVTGGSRGIGAGIVKALAAEGARVAVVYRGNQAAADALVREKKKKTKELMAQVPTHWGHLSSVIYKRGR
jgi:3-oxoacyl-[acyl-carrier protein] reductase